MESINNRLMQHIKRFTTTVKREFVGYVYTPISTALHTARRNYFDDRTHIEPNCHILHFPLNAQNIQKEKKSFQNV